MRIRKMLAAVLLAACAARAGAAVVTLTDGSVLRGKVTGQTLDGIELATPDGTLHVALARIARIDYGDQPPPPPPLLVPLPGVEPPLPRRSVAERRQLLELGFGLVQPVSKVNFNAIGGGSADNGDLGAQIAAQYVYFLTPRLGAGVDLDYFSPTGTLSERLFPAASASVSGDTWLMMGILRYSFMEHGTARPFLLVGAGGALNSETVDVRPNGNWSDTGTHETRRLIDDSAWTPAASARIGLDLDIDALDPGIITVEMGWTGLASARYAATPAGQAQGLSGIAAPVSILSFTVRYGWRF